MRDGLLEGRQARQSLDRITHPLGFSHSYVGPIHATLHRNYLHITTKGIIAQSDLLFMERQSQISGNPSLYKKIPRIKEFKSALYHYINLQSNLS